MAYSSARALDANEFPPYGRDADGDGFFAKTEIKEWAKTGGDGDGPSNNVAIDAAARDIKADGHTVTLVHDTTTLNDHRMAA